MQNNKLLYINTYIFCINLKLDYSSVTYTHTHEQCKTNTKTSKNHKWPNDVAGVEMKDVKVKQKNQKKK